MLSCTGYYKLQRDSGSSPEWQKLGPEWHIGF
jgi:hypothetical protein